MEVHVTTTLNFGGRPSQALSNLAKLETSKLFILPVSEISHINVTFSLTDDILLLSMNPTQLDEMKRIIEAGLRLTN